MKGLEINQKMTTNNFLIVFLILCISILPILSQKSGFATETFLPVEAFASGVGGVDVEMEDGKVVLEGEDGMFDGTSDRSWNNLFRRYKSIIAGLSGIATLTMLGAFIYNITKLGATSGDSKARGNCLMAILFTGLATAGLGSVTIIMAFFYNSFAGL